MTRFRYARDPLCLLACACYAVNRFAVPFAAKGWFLRGYFNDALLIPAALPFALWLQRRGGLRHDDSRPGWAEIGLHVLVWSIAAEVIAPHWIAHATGDPWDVTAYAGGALIAGLVWQHA